MLTKKTAINQSRALINELRAMGYSIPRAVLFGSFSRGNAHKDSDIDLALWDDKFTGSLSIDYEPVKNILSKFTRIELHTFNNHDTPDNHPFVALIDREGIEIH